MEQHEPLARLTLDTLPMNIAVLDGDGTILFTNQSWDTFDEEAVEGSGMTGTNYFAGIDLTEDEYAAQAVDGIQSVMEGDQSLFTLEYPCDTPEESKWFLMRVVPLDTDGEEVVVAHIDITDRKLAELRAEERARELQAERQHLEHLIRRINGLVGNVMEALMAAETPADVQASLCEQFADTTPYVLAWVAEVDLSSERLVPSAWSDERTKRAGIDLDDSHDPTAIAANSRAIQVVDDMTSLPADSFHTDIGSQSRSMAAVPLVADGSMNGVLTVYAAETGAFDERETVVLEALGRMAATAIDAIERKRILTADTVLDVEIEIADDERFVFDLSRHGHLEYAGSVHRENSQLMFFVVEGIDPETVLTRASDDPGVIAATHVSSFETGSLFEFEMHEPPIVQTLASRGAETRSLAVSAGTARVEANLSADADVRALLEALATTFDGADLVSVRERERPTRTRQEFVSHLMDSLTDRQRTALQKAYVGGFFEWPRTTSGETLAASMDISPSTYHQHLRAAQRKLVTELFDG